MTAAEVVPSSACRTEAVVAAFAAAAAPRTDPASLPLPFPSGFPPCSAAGLRPGATTLGTALPVSGGALLAAARLDVGASAANLL